MSRRTWRIGLMGCGTVARYGHMPALKRCDGLDVAAVYDPSPQAVESFRREFGVASGFTDAAAFFASGIDAVSICSAAPAHLSNVLDAAAHGKHILCEKPLAMTEEEGVRMIEATRRAGVMLSVGFDYRFSPVAQAIHRMVREKTVGEVRSLRLIYVWHLHGKVIRQADGTMVLNQRRVGRMLEGGPMVDCGVHQIDLARWWLGREVVRVHGEGAWVEDFEAPDHVWAHLDFDGGAHAMVEMSYTYGHTVAEPAPSFTYHLIGTDGLIRYDAQAKFFEVRTAEQTLRLAFAGEKNFQGMYEAWARSLSTGSPDGLPTAEDGLIATRIARTATEQAMSRRRGANQPA